jgi:hypothetical protein
MNGESNVNRTPAWTYVVGLVFLLMAITTIGYTWKSCGWKTLLLGNGGFYAAVLGLCEEK